MKIHTVTTDCRCKACGALLAKLDRDGLTIRRGDMQVVVSGDSTVAVTCYRDRCRTLNVLSSRNPTPPMPANALRLLAALVTMVQGREHHELASALLWLGLWPGLSGIFGRRVRHFEREPDELIAEIARAFTELVERLDLTSVQRVAATLVRSTERDLMYRKKRAWSEPKTRRDGDHDADGDPFDVSRFDAPSFERWGERESGSVLGLTPGLSFDEDVAVLRAWLEPVVGEDAELLIAVLVEGESRREVGERLGLATDSGRKRVQRAVGRLKKHLAKSLSRFARADRVPHPQAR